MRHKIALPAQTIGEPFVGQMNRHGRNDPGLGPGMHIFIQKDPGIRNHPFDTGRCVNLTPVDHKDAGRGPGRLQPFAGQAAEKSAAHDPEGFAMHKTSFVRNDQAATALDAQKNNI